MAGESGRSAAFFDLDNTLIRGASMFFLAQGLHRCGMLSTKAMLAGMWKQVYFRITGLEDPRHVREVRESALAFIKGRSVAEMDDLCRQIFTDEVEKRIWPESAHLAQRHLDEGRDVWLVTAAPVELATIIAGRLGLTGALGTVAEREDGVYTGRLDGDFLHGAAKANAVRRLAEEHGYDLATSYAYSDSANDLPMLTAVGNPGVINADAKLLLQARRHGWPIRDVRAGHKAARSGFLSGLGFALVELAAVFRRQRR